MNNLIPIIALLLEFFEDDESRVAFWLAHKNPGLGDQRPIDMIVIGRSHKLLEFIKNQMSENQPPSISEQEIRKEFKELIIKGNYPKKIEKIQSHDVTNAAHNLFGRGSVFMHVENIVIWWWPKLSEPADDQSIKTIKLLLKAMKNECPKKK